MKNREAVNDKNLRKCLKNDGYLEARRSTDGKNLTIQMGTLEKYEKICGGLVVRPCNIDSNLEVLKDGIYNRIGDIALALYVSIGVETGRHMDAMVPARLLSVWKKNQENVMEVALKNTYDFSRPMLWCIQDLSGAGSEAGYDFMNQETLPADTASILGTIVSNADNFYGAVSVFLPGVAEKLGRLLDSDFYIAFTSRHEAIIHKTGVIGAEMIREALKSMRKELTLGGVFLTEQVYQYSRKTGGIEVVQQ